MKKILYSHPKNFLQAVQKVIMLSTDRELRKNAFDAFKRVRLL